MISKLIVELDILFPDHISGSRQAVGCLRRWYYFLHRYIPAGKAFQVFVCYLCATRTPGGPITTGKYHHHPASYQLTGFRVL